jgi:sigma-B regulation protein RsbU (phosphoserine phosphatase)
VAVAKSLLLAGFVSGRQQTWPLDRPRIRIGRANDSSIQILDDTVSREQAEIVAEGDLWLLRNLSGKNVTRVNGVPVKAPVPLRLGDRITLGHVVLRVTDGAAPPPSSLGDLDTLETTLEVPAAEVLARGLEGEASPPTVVRALIAAGGLLVQENPLRETCDELLRILDPVVAASRLILLVRRPPQLEPVQMAARCRGEVASAPLLLSRGILSAVLESGTSVITKDAMADSRFKGRDSVVALKTRSAMAVPLYEGGSVQGLLYADQESPMIHYKRRDLELLTLVGNMIAVKIANDRLVEDKKILVQIEHELAVAGGIQRGLLPAEPPHIAGYECHAVIQSCEAVGGDLYDFHPMPDGSVYFLLGDVAGKGIAAALLMSHFLAFADALYEHCEEPADLAARLNVLLARRIEGSRFVTAFIGRLEPRTGILRYANAGHPSPMVLGQGPILELASTGPPCGASSDFEYPGGTVQLTPGSLLAVFSDGIPEARKSDEEYFELKRLARLLAAGSRAGKLESLGQSIIGEVDSFLGGRPRQDDVALLLLRRGQAG